MAIRKTRQHPAWAAGLFLALGAGLGTQPAFAAPAVYGPITQGDSVWSVVHKMGGGNIQQRMQALFKANPTAFVNGDQPLESRRGAQSRSRIGHAQCTGSSASAGQISAGICP